MSSENIKKFTTEFAGFLDAMKMLGEIESLDDELEAAKRRLEIARKQAVELVEQGKAERAQAQADGEKLLDDARTKCHELKASAAREIKSTKDRAEAELGQFKGQRERLEAQIAGLRKQAEELLASVQGRQGELGSLNDAIASATERHESLKAQLTKIKRSLEV